MILDLPTLELAYDNGIVQMIDHPHYGTVCQVGTPEDGEWFFCGGLLAEECTAKEYVRYCDKREMLADMLRTINSFRDAYDADMHDEYEYICDIIEEGLKNDH